jgi:predicted flap endonuclease-1-like 5' DNA nuclease
MPYTLVKGLVWVVLALLIGGVIGWLLRSVKTRRQVAKARAAAAAAAAAVEAARPADAKELERLRLRLAELEPIVAERDRLRAELEPIVVERDRVRAAIESVRPTQTSGSSSLSPASSTGHSFALERPRTPDVAAAAAVLGREIELDDLRVVVGVGPAIESLCRRIGIRTWWDLATTEPSLLRTLLTEARPGLATDDSASWPLQARLLAEGRWAEFKALTDELAAGRPSD